MRMTATAAVYNRLHNTSVGVVGGVLSPTSSLVCSGAPGHHHQFARSIERVLEEAHLSGELILTNRKLKDFPKTCGKYNLNDTVIADLSRNRFCELPDEITSFSFLETLLLYHNVIRSIPESVKYFTSLTYLDLRTNQLSSLPREVCFLPLQVLLVSNNRLIALPDELGRMSRLTDLDASYNQLSTLPTRIGELHSMRSFSLRNNLLMYLPRELSGLPLVSLDVSNNLISSLPLEIRKMSTLVALILENNPLTSPPASLCTRGLVHIFKFLETQAIKEEKDSRTGNYDGYTTLRRVSHNNSSDIGLEIHRSPRQLVDSGYIYDASEKRWSHDMPLKSKNSSTKSIISTIHTLPRVPLLNGDLMSVSSANIIVDESVNLAAAAVKPVYMENKSASEMSSSSINRYDKNNLMQHQKQYPSDIHNHSNSNSGSTSDLHNDTIDHNEQLQSNEKHEDQVNKNIGNIQTYREYKEALKQQRSQDVYKLKEQKQAIEHMESQYPELNEGTKMLLYGSTQSVPTSKFIVEKSANNSNTTLNSAVIIGTGSDVSNAIVDSALASKKPIQKVSPSINAAQIFATKHDVLSTVATKGCVDYVKPNSPRKTLNISSVNSGICLTAIENDILTNNNKFTTATTRASLGIKSPADSVSNKMVVKVHRNVAWNRDVVSDKLSFTMRREFDRQREEIELMTQLRSIIENRLKMTLPDDIASSLTDGVILCHLANYVRPRSVASIHVPSPGISKLTMARCRRNVDNFLEACRKIGVDEELICSCSDVTSLSEDDTYNEGMNDIYNKNTSNKESFSYVDPGRTNNENRKQQFKVFKNPSAVLKTVAGLIAMDCNLQHQRENLQPHRKFQTRLEEYQNHIQAPLRILEDNKHILVNKKKENESQEQNNLTATCIKEQMIAFENSNYEKFGRYDLCSIDSGTDFYGDNSKKNYCYYGYDIVSRFHKGKKQKNNFNSPTLRGGNLYRHCKLKPFKKIKFNFITHHGKSGNSVSNHFSSSSSSLLSSAIEAKALQTIVETDNDIINGGTLSPGLYQIINDKYKIKRTEKFMVNVINSEPYNNSSAFENIAHIKYKLFDLSSSIEKSQSDLSSTAKAIRTTVETGAANATGSSNTVSKRIEFFEHPDITNAGIIKPKSNIYSIYRVNENMLLPNKSGGSKSATFQLKPESYSLTIILSCVFIATFLVLVLFPLQG